MKICIPYHWPHAVRKHHDVLILLGILLSAVIFQAQANLPTDLEVHEQLRKLNKPAVKTILTEDDVIDCVDIYKQPAFDHPLLKNHKIEMSPTFNGKMKNIKFNGSAEMFKQPWQKHGRCPEGTIPIKRVQRSDLLRARSAQGYGLNDDTYQDCNIIPAGADTVGTFNALEGDIAVWKPSVQANEWSLASVALRVDKNGGDESLMQAGWMINPGLFDDQPRIFVHWRNSSSGAGCFNLLCSGFVHLTPELALGSVITSVSEYGQKPKFISASINLDDKKNWWVTLKDTLLGYFPAALMPEFTATKAAWGGSVCERQGSGGHTATQMGSGHFASEGWQKAAHVRNMVVLNPGSDTYTPPTPLQILDPKPNCYSAVDGGKVDPSLDIGPTVYFGGPGGNC